MSGRAPTTEAEKAKERELLAWVKSLNVTADAQDYSKGLAGTKLDTILEKAYGDILKGVEDLAMKDRFPPQPCSCTLDAAGNHGSDCRGRWLRALGRSGCWLYVHTITHKVTGVQPDGYIPDEAAELARQRRQAAARGRHPTFPASHPDALAHCLRRIISEQGKTPVIVADEPGVLPLVKAALEASGGLLVSTRPWVLPASRTGIKFEDHFAAVIVKLTAAIKMGGLLVFDCEDSAPHFLEKLCQSPKYRGKFPEQVFNPRAQGWAKDLTYGQPAKPGFGVALLTSLPPGEYERELKDKVPWSMCAGVRASTFIPAELLYLADLPAALDKASGSGLAPLVLDGTGTGAVDTYLGYQRTQQVDVMQLLGSARTPDEMREVLRAKLVSCLKAGDILLLRMRDGAPDLLGAGMISEREGIPLAAFNTSEITQQAWLDRLYQPEELEHNVAVARPGFKLVVTATQPLDGFAAALSRSLPLSRCSALFVEPDMD